MTTRITFVHYVPLIAALVCLGLAYYVYVLGAGPIPLLFLSASAAICIGVFFVFDYPRLRYMRTANRLMKIGIPAQARIIKVEQTSKYLNLRPQIRLKVSFIHPQTGQKITAVAADYFDAHEIGSLRPGASLTIRFNPDHPEETCLS